MATSQRTKRIVISVLLVVVAILTGKDVINAVQNAAVAITQPDVAGE
jgi:hypothetical protein